MRYPYCMMMALAFSVACSSDKPSSRAQDAAGAEPGVEAGKAPVLPPLGPLRKSATELKAEGWTATEVPADVAARLRDSAQAGQELNTLAVRRELLTLLGSVPSFDSLGGFADTVRLVERALIRMGSERRDEREAAIVDSLQRAMKPNDPDLKAVSVEPALPSRALNRPPYGDAPVYLASARSVPGSRPFTPAFAPSQGGQTKTFQLAPGINGTETSSSDGSSVTTEIGLKGGDDHGTGEVSMKSTTSLQDGFEKAGEVGGKRDLNTRKKGKIGGSEVEETKEGTGEERLSYCPDAAGLAHGRYKHRFREAMKATVNGVTGFYDITIDADFALTVQVNDDARATELLVDGYTDLHADAGQRGGGNKTPIIMNGRGEGRAQGVSLEANAANWMGSWHLRFPSDVSGRKLNSLQNALMEELVLAIAAGRALAEQAEKRWRNGACVEVTTQPESKSLRYSGKTTFRTQVRHKRDRGAFPYPVRMMIEKRLWADAESERKYGRIYGTLTPRGVVTAPITYHYTAPAKGTEPAESWTRKTFPPEDEMFPISVSRRGIGVARFVVPYDSVRRTFHVTYHRRRETAKHGVAQDVTYRAVLRELDQPDDDGDTFAGTGDYSLLARLWKANCASYAPEELEVISGGGAVRAKGSISSEDPGSISLIFQLEPLSGPRMRMFTRSFTGLEQQLRKQVASSNQDDVPFMAGQAVGLVTVRGKLGDTTRVVVTGETECEGEMSTRTSARVTRLR